MASGLFQTRDSPHCCFFKYFAAQCMGKAPTFQCSCCLNHAKAVCCSHANTRASGNCSAGPAKCTQLTPSASHSELNVTALHKLCHQSNFKFAFSWIHCASPLILPIIAALSSCLPFCFLHLCRPQRSSRGGSSSSASLTSRVLLWQTPSDCLKGLLLKHAPDLPCLSGAISLFTSLDCSESCVV